MSMFTLTACDDDCEHKYGGWTIKTAATCETDGVREKTCSECKDVKSEKIAATGHNYVGNICTDCGKTK